MRFLIPGTKKLLFVAVAASMPTLACVAQMDGPTSYDDPGSYGELNDLPEQSDLERPSHPDALAQDEIDTGPAPLVEEETAYGEYDLVTPPFLGGPAMDSEIGVATITETDLVSRLHAAHQREIALAKAALTLSDSLSTRALAERMLMDLEFADRSLLALARDGSLDVPEPAMDTAEDRAGSDVSKLMEFRGADFDREFVRIAQSSQGERIQLLAVTQAQLPGNSRLRALASRFTPIAEQHQAAAAIVAVRITEDANT